MKTLKHPPLILVNLVLCWMPRVLLLFTLVLAWTNLAFGSEIHDAALNGDLEKVKALLKGDPELVFSQTTNKDDEGSTPLHFAALNGHKEVAELLLANRAKVDATNGTGWTPLHVAVFCGNTGSAELLRQHGGHE